MPEFIYPFFAIYTEVSINFGTFIIPFFLIKERYPLISFEQHSGQSCSFFKVSPFTFNLLIDRLYTTYTKMQLMYKEE